MLGDNLEKEVELESALKQYIKCCFFILVCFSLKVEGHFKRGK